MNNQHKTKKIIIIGAGSIGRRHAANLQTLGVEVSIHDIAKEFLLQLCREKGYTPVINLDRALDNDEYDAAVICTPNHLHLSIGEKIIDANLDFFIEKPLSHTYEGVDRFVHLVNKKKLITMAGFNMRFEPGLKYIKKMLDPSKVAFAQIEFGSYLPKWRSGVDYREIYSARKSMGGGVILDVIHELDYACWLFGYPDSVSCTSGQFSNLEIDVEDTAAFHFRYPDKLVTVHMDYLQRKKTRRCKICYRDGYSLEWKSGEGVYEYGPNGSDAYEYKEQFDVNSIYIEEIKTFLHCIRERIPPESGIKNAADILKIALHAKGTEGL